MTENEKNKKFKKIKDLKHRGKIGFASGAIIALLLTHKGCVLQKGCQKTELENPEDFKKYIHSLEIEFKNPLELIFKEPIKVDICNKTCDKICNKKQVKVVEKKVVTPKEIVVTQKQEKVVEQQIIEEQVIEPKTINTNVFAPKITIVNPTQEKVVQEKIIREERIKEKVIIEQITETKEKECPKEKQPKEKQPKEKEKHPKEKECPKKKEGIIGIIEVVEVVLPPKEESKIPILEEIAKENQKEIQRGNAYQMGAQAGATQCYEDGALNRTFNNNPQIDLSNFDEDARKEYIAGFKEYYTSSGYQDGQALTGGTIEHIEIIDYNENVSSQKKGNNNIAGLNDLKETLYNSEEIPSVDNSYLEEKELPTVNESNIPSGFYEKDGKIYDENGYEVQSFAESSNENISTNVSNEVLQEQNETYLNNKTYVDEKGIKTTEEIIMEPGFYEKDNKFYNKNNSEIQFNEPKESTNVNQDIAALQTLREVLNDSIDNSNEIGYAKTL